MKTVVRGQLGLKEVDVCIEDGMIVDIGEATAPQLTGAATVATSGRLLPGYIDVHVHGGGGAEVMQGTEEAYEQICKTHAAHGTTGLLLTTITESDEAITKALRSYRRDRERDGAQVLGFHLEGPFICEARAGAQPKEHIQAPSVEKLRRWMAESGSAVRYMTLAPEVDGALEVVREARRLGIHVSAGHSTATYDQAMGAFTAGIDSVTHLYNAMSSLHHRDPGLLGAALTHPDIYAELIADRLHVHDAAMNIAFQMKGRHRLMLITDAVMAACMPEGTMYRVGREPVTVENGSVRLADGTLAGSTLTLDRAVQNLLHTGIIDEDDVEHITSLNQANLLGLPHGRMEVGAPANLIAVDSDWNVTHTFVQGRLVYRR
ncbi:N-acetylglucosamine-6-phosphate deacetylase [Alicyclobacillus dauci]|uniref:N-acetylglucosamine-6-phosphate deacetylase n=1 Tax=Alicyclobacillus dauci TaxID=1475485 RepID=A0ABY6YZT9_9BACL|nr:N-acetylglucosamine-6-phosphate deacetylase [Alicyclobacillus dauci]WAH36025.1 N-acetylglucosamine-6-phosphate deacetylase [Alicyclobacillus dauci]